jgi:hypothetical protein
MTRAGFFQRFDGGSSTAVGDGGADLARGDGRTPANFPRTNTN